ncbi:ATP-dependent helicase [Clostridium akagii]|uniref:ATP-dependent helicase n=1 Tax=Clostridium akagii TaxID=91623 RepID=UPI0004787D49|nr:ATP-dependent helicase [Clostridium akagii]
MIKEKLIDEFCSLRDKIIEKRYERLDNSQINAVIKSDRNCIVIACPGAGKTQVIINRVDYLCTFGEVYGTKCVDDCIEQKHIDELKSYLTEESSELPEKIKSFAVKRENIIIITFTKAAATNMKNRYKKLFPGGKEPFFGTFHGLFYKILKRHKNFINIIQGYETNKVVKNVLLMYMDEVNKDKLREVIGDISKFKTSRLSLEEFKPSIEDGIFKKCLDAYEDYKEEKNLMDFDDLQLQCLELFTNNANLLEGYRRLFKYMLVDEFQDSDSLQIDLLKMLNGANSLYAVGDEDQCIYGFRGSRPECMVDFPEIFNGGKKIYLSKNYRSKSDIVNISKNLIRNNVLRNEKKIVGNKVEKGNIHVLNNANENTQAEEIYINIVKMKEINQINYSDFVILYRTNVESRSLIDNFIRRKVPFKLLDKEYNFFEHFICKDILAYLRLSIDNTDKASFLRIINKPFRYIGKLSLEKVRSNEFKEDLFEVLKNVDDLPIFQMKSVDKLKKDIQGLNKKSLGWAIQTIITELGYNDYINEYSQKFKNDINELLQIIEEFKKSAEEYKNIVSFLSHVEEVSEELKNIKKDSTKDAVILSTIHGVKGMEFKNVFIINCCEETIPHKSGIEKNLEEERRLFYVGITRAIDNLWLGISRDIRGKAKEPSRFVAECGLEFNNPYTGQYKVGEIVKHESFGKGKITKIDCTVVEIEFDAGVKRKFDPVVLGNNKLIEKAKAAVK